MEAHWCPFKTPLSPDEADKIRINNIIRNSQIKCVNLWRGELIQTPSGFLQIKILGRRQGSSRKVKLNTILPLNKIPFIYDSLKSGLIVIFSCIHNVEMFSLISQTSISFVQITLKVCPFHH